MKNTTKKYLKINGFIFDNVKQLTQKASDIISDYNYYFNRGYLSIYNAYSKPSQRKINAFNNNLKMIKTIDSNGALYVGGFNCNMFTLYASVKHNKKRYILKITKNGAQALQVE